MFQGPFHQSVIKRAVNRGLVRIQIHDIREYAHDSHRTTDDYQYGGGPGMVMKLEPVFESVEAALSPYPEELRREIPVILLSPQGRPFRQDIAHDLAASPGMALICGHYEGVDERIKERLATDEISIGDYVLTGGELPSMVLVDAVVRLIPGVVGIRGGRTGGLHNLRADSTPRLHQTPLVPGYGSTSDPAIGQSRRDSTVAQTAVPAEDLEPASRLVEVG